MKHFYQAFFSVFPSKQVADTAKIAIVMRSAALRAQQQKVLNIMAGLKVDERLGGIVYLTNI